MIKHALVDNRDALIAQSMLKGKDRQQAASEIDLVFAILDYLHDASLDFKVEPSQMSLDVQVSFDP